MLWMGRPKVHVVCDTSASAVPLYALRKVPRTAIAILGMTS
jgi:hypothetical protein